MITPSHHKRMRAVQTPTKNVIFQIHANTQNWINY